MAEIIDVITENTLNKAALVIKEGGLVIFPTETVYGLGACAFNPIAVAKIFEVKKRPYFDPLIVHVAKKDDVEQICAYVSDNAKLLIEKFWPGPLTLVLPKKDIVPDIVTAGLDSVAVRMPSHPIALKLIKLANVPIAAPSANLFGHLSPTKVEDISEEIKEKVDLIIDGGKCTVGIESTVLDLCNEPTILRYGGTTIEDIEKVIGKVKVLTIADKPKSPGQLLHHYSPRTPLKILRNEIPNIPHNAKVGFLAFKQPEKNLPFDAVEVLSSSGNLVEAAANLFSSLHRLDKAGLDIIYAEQVPEVGLGCAIMERLYKAERKEK